MAPGFQVRDVQGVADALQVGAQQGVGGTEQGQDSVLYLVANLKRRKHFSLQFLIAVLPF